METFLKILHYLSGPVIGAAIGYLTNYLAVKMLFRPYKEKRIGKVKIPFTPGIVPKRQEQLAKAIGVAVGEKLFTKEDVKNAVLSSAAKERISAAIEDAVYGANESGERTGQALLCAVSDEQGCEEVKTRLAALVTDKLIAVAKEARIGGVLAQKIGEAVKEKKSSLGLFAAFIGDDTIDGLLQGAEGKIDGYIEERGAELIAPYVAREIEALGEKPLKEALPKEAFEKAVNVIFERAAEDVADTVLSAIDISAIVEEKVKAMDVRELEKLCLSVMKKELNAVVNLGALLGFLIGVANIFF